MRAICLDRLCLAKTVVIKYSVLRMQIYKSTRYMFLNHCLYLNIHPLPFNPIAIVLLQGGFPGSLCDWLVYSERYDINSSAIWLKRWIVHVQCIRARAWDSGSSSLVFLWWAVFNTTIHLLGHEKGRQANQDGYWWIALCHHIWAAFLFERSYLTETLPQLATKR